MAQGHRQVVAISPSMHPSCRPELEDHFHVAYTEFWRSLMGRAGSPFGYVIDLPMQMTPLDAARRPRRQAAQARSGAPRSHRGRPGQRL
jgi:uncharacterized protein VirK/YbjX